MKRPGVRSIAINAANLAGARLLTFVLRAFYILVLADRLGPELYGLFAYGSNYYAAFLPFAFLGMRLVLGRMIGRQGDRAIPLASSALAIRLVTALLAAALCAVVAWFLEDEPRVRWLLGVFALGLLGRGLANLANEVFVATETSRHTLRLEGAFRGLEVVAGLCILWAGGGLFAVAGLHAIVWWLQAAIGFVAMRRVVGPIAPRWEGSLIRTMMVQAIPLAIGNLFITWQLLGPVVLFRHAEQGAEVLGHFGLAYQAFGVLAGVPGAMVVAALPVLSRAAQRSDGKDMMFVAGTVRLAIIVGAAVGIVAMGIGTPLIEAILGPRYREAGLYFGWALWLVIPWTVASVAGQVVVARGHLKAHVVLAAIGAILTSLLTYYLARAGGAEGALLGSVTGLSIWAIAEMAYVRRLGGPGLGRSLLRPVLAIGLALAAYAALTPIHSVLAMTAALAALIIGALAVGVVKKAEWRVIGDLIRERKKS